MSEAQLAMADFEGWLNQNLAGKSLDRARSKQPGRLVFLLRDDRELVERCELYFGPHGVEVRGAWAGSEDVPRLFIRARFSDWVAYLREPSPERAKALELYGATQVLGTFAELLELKQGMVDFRVGMRKKNKSDSSLGEEVP